MLKYSGLVDNLAAIAAPDRKQYLGLRGNKAFFRQYSQKPFLEHDFHPLSDKTYSARPIIALPDLHQVHFSSRGFNSENPPKNRNGQGETASLKRCH